LIIISRHGACEVWFRDIQSGVAVCASRAVLSRLGWGRERLRVSGSILYLHATKAGLFWPA
jgi:hypothetical protein